MAILLDLPSAISASLPIAILSVASLPTIAPFPNATEFSDPELTVAPIPLIEFRASTRLP